MDRIRTGRLAPIVPALDRIRRSDPFLMAAAIAYNTFFAMVPMAIALFAWVSLVGRSEVSLARLEEALTEVLPPDVAAFILRLIADTGETLDGAEGVVILVALAIALYSGSRAVYATIKALRLIQDGEEHRGWVRVRGLGILFTFAAGAALVVGQAIILVGSDLLRTIEEWTGMAVFAEAAGALVGPVLVVWVVLLFAAIYQWGPPEPAPYPVVSAVAATVLVGIGSWIYGVVVPQLGLTTIGILGTVGFVLLWTYSMAFIVIVVPELVGAAVLLVRRAGSTQA